MISEADLNQIPYPNVIKYTHLKSVLYQNNDKNNHKISVSYHGVTVTRQLCEHSSSRLIYHDLTLSQITSTDSAAQFVHLAATHL